MARKLTAEAIGTGLLLFIIVGSGIMVQTAGSDPATQLFIHAIAVGVGLAALIAMFAMVSGSHFNPAVTVALWLDRRIAAREVAPYGSHR